MPVHAAIIMCVFWCRRTDRLTMLDFLKVTAKIQFALFNGVVLGWREKVMSHGMM